MKSFQANTVSRVCQTIHFGRAHRTRVCKLLVSISNIFQTPRRCGGSSFHSYMRKALEKPANFITKICGPSKSQGCIKLAKAAADHALFVAQVSQPAVSRVSQPAIRARSRGQPTGKSATQVGKPALRKIAALDAALSNSRTRNLPFSRTRNIVRL